MELFRSDRAALFQTIPVQSGDIVFIGNSLTEAFPLSEMFKSPRIKNRGISGDATKEIMLRTKDVANGKPAKVFFECGINDIKRNVPLDTMAENFSKAISYIKAISPSTKIYIQTTLPIRPGVFGDGELLITRNRQVVSWNRWLKDFSGKNNIAFIDLYAAFQDQGVLKSNLTYDGVHLMKEGYYLWADMVKDHIREQ
ncbi:SGNH/GDSL hydrolase family protein [Amycolatopsis magusensis]